jgi:hypothetical protein
MPELIRTARELLDELNRSASSGLITAHALALMGQLQRALSKVERA